MTSNFYTVFFFLLFRRSDKENQAINYCPLDIQYRPIDIICVENFSAFHYYPAVAAAGIILKFKDKKEERREYIQTCFTIHTEISYLVVLSGN